MNRLDYFFRQRVSESELDLGFTYAEDALSALAADQSRTLILSGLVCTQQASPNMTALCTAGIAYTAAGQRAYVPTNQNVNLAADYNAVATTVVGGANEKWLSIFVQNDRSLTDPRTDGNGATVYFNRAETFKYKVVQGAEAGSGLAVRPSLDANLVLLCDVKIVFGTTTIINSMIDTTRRQDSIVASGSPRALRRGLTKDALSDLLGYYNNHVTAVADKHPAADVTYAGGGAWNEGTTNPAASVEAQLDKIITDLTVTTQNSSGSKKIASNISTPATPAYSPSGFSLSSGSVQSHISALLGAINATAGAAHMVGFATGNEGGGTVARSSSALGAGDATWELALAGLVSGDVVILVTEVLMQAATASKMAKLQWYYGENGASPSTGNLVGTNPTQLFCNSNATYNTGIVIGIRTVGASGDFKANLAVASVDNATSISFLAMRRVAIALR